MWGRLLRKEMLGGLRSRWFFLYCLVFLGAGAFLAVLGVGRTGLGGYRVSLRSAAALMQLILLMLPPMALLQGISVLSDERESGLMEYLLAQPVTAGQVYLTKWLSTSVLVSSALVLGMGPGAGAGLVRGAPLGVVGGFLLIAVMLAVAFVGLGLAAAAIWRTRTHAVAAGIAIWLGLTVLGTLGMMAAFVRWQIPATALMTWSLVNPIEAFRLAVMVILDSDLSLLGPVGVELLGSFGRMGLAVLCAGSLLVWAAVPGWIGSRVFRSRPLP